MSRRVVVIGGPAGMSCALWLKHLRLTPYLIEQSDSLGGLQRLSKFHNAWFLGSVGMTGEALASQFSYHMQVENIPVLVHAAVTAIAHTEKGYNLLITHGDPEKKELSIAADAIVIATGTRLRELETYQDIPGFDAVVKAECMTNQPASFDRVLEFAGKHVMVIGGGDNGFETALLLARAAAHVDLVIRSEIKAQQWIVEEIKMLQSQGVVTLHCPASIQEFVVKNGRVHTTLQAADGKEKMIGADYIFSRTGFKPNIENIQEALQRGGSSALACDKQKYLITDAQLRTSLKQIYAAGDVVNPVNPCVATAVGQGTIAARTIEYDLR